MRSLLTALVILTAACAPPTPPSFVEAPPPSGTVLRRDYDVLLEVTPSLQLRARLFPNAPVTAIDVQAFESADAAPIPAWHVEATGDSALVEPGVATTLGVTPAGWVETVPFAGAKAGTTYVVTLTAADGEGRATRLVVDGRVKPTLRVQSGAGLLIANTEPAVPVTRVTLRDASGALVWEGRYPDAQGVLLPAAGFVVGEAPPTWDALYFPTNANLVAGAAYRVEVAVAGDEVLTDDLLFLSSEQPAFAPLHSEALSLPPRPTTSWYLATRIFETLDGNFGAFQRDVAMNGSELTSPTWFVDPRRAPYTTLSYAATPDVAPAAVATGTMAGIKTLWAQSPIVPFESNRFAFAAYYSSSRSVPGRLSVVERSATPGFLPYGGGETWNAGWSLVGGPIGTAVASSADVTVNLARGLVTGLPMSTQQPWLVAVTDRSGKTASLSWFDQQGAWVPLSFSGLVPPEHTLGSIRRLMHTVTTDGRLVVLAEAQVFDAANTPFSDFVLAEYVPASSTWTRLEVLRGSSVQGTDDAQSMHLVERGGVVAASMRIYGPMSVATQVFCASPDGSVTVMPFGEEAFANSPLVPLVVRDLGLDERHRPMLAVTANLNVYGNAQLVPSLRVMVASTDSEHASSWAKLLETPLPMLMPSAPELGESRVSDLHFSPNASGVLMAHVNYRFEQVSNMTGMRIFNQLWRVPVK